MSAVAQRLAAQLLTRSGARRSAEAVVERILAVQGQDGRGLRLAVRARSRGLSAADVDRALSEERTLLITWLNRGTLHLVRREDYPWLHALTTPPLLTEAARRLVHNGIGPDQAERGLAVIARRLAEDGPLTRAQLAARLDAAGVPARGQAMIQLLFLAALRGIAVRGPVEGGQHAYALVRDWLGPQPRVDRERALAELGRRYLAGHGPAGERDLAYWTGLPLRDARAALASIGGELRACGDGLVQLETGARRTRRMPPPRLLGSFDPILHGWRSRQPITGDHDRRIVSGGIFRPFALIGGRVAAAWRIDRGLIAIEPFSPIDPADAAHLAAEGEDVVRYLGLQGR